MIKLLFIVLCLFELPWHTDFSSLVILTNNREGYGLDRETTDRMIAAHKGRSDETLSEIIEKELSKSQLQKLEAACFQHNLGMGSTKRIFNAYKIAFTPEKEKEFKAIKSKARQRCDGQIRPMAYELGMHFLAKYTNDTEQMVGEPFEFHESEKRKPFEVDLSFAVDHAPFLLLGWPEVIKELNITVGQTKAKQLAMTELYKKDLLPDAEELDFDMVELDGIETNTAASNEIYRAAIGFMKPGQVSRFNEILLQWYVSCCPKIAFFHLKRMNPDIEIKKHDSFEVRQEFFRQIEVIMKFICTKNYTPIVKEVVGDEFFRRRLLPKYHPHKDGKKIPFNREVFEKLGLIKPDRKRTRRREGGDDSGFDRKRTPENL